MHTILIAPVAALMPILMATTVAGAEQPVAQVRILQLAENLVKYSSNPVLDVGQPGAWDDKGCGCFSVVEANDRFHLYYMGAGEKNSWRIGLATSENGIDWQRSSANPVLPQGSAGSWDDKAVSMPYVLNDNGRLSLYYSGSGKGGGFGLATSKDGVKWQRHGNAPVLLGNGGSMDPCVRKFDGRFHIWYVGQRGKSYRLFHATSADGIKWDKEPNPILPLGNEGDFDERHHAGPVVLRIGGSHYLFHLGASSKGWKLGLAISTDGVTWKKSSVNPILDVGGKSDWDGGSIMSHDVIWKDGRFHVWYAAHAVGLEDKQERDMAIRIGYATSKPPTRKRATAKPVIPIQKPRPAKSSLIAAPQDLPPDSSGKPQQARRAAEQGLQFIENKAIDWIKTRKCVACHHGPFLLWTHDEAKRAGIAIDENKLSEWTQWALKNSSPQKMDKACDDDLDAHHQLRLSRSPTLLDVKTEASFRAISNHLIGRQQPDGSWIPGNRFRTQQRRSQQESKEVTTMWSVLALGTVEKNAAGRTKSCQKALTWLKEKRPGKSNESQVLHLLIQHEFGEADRKRELLKALLGQQNGDGGWSWMNGEASDALATGLSLYALTITGPSEISAIHSAQRFLLNTQQKDGSWVVPTTLTTSKLAECGVPNYWGTAWATIGLLRTLPKPDADAKAKASADAEPPLAEAPFDAVQAKEFRRLWASHISKDLFYTNSIGMKLSLIPPGEFTMGRTEKEFDRLLEIFRKDPELKKNEGGMVTWSLLMMPAHKVRLTKPFYLGTTEVTVKQFRQFAEASGYRTEAEQGLNHGKPITGKRPVSTWRKPMAWRRNYVQTDDEPVLQLCWNDCVAFCQWLSEKEGREYVLPTEAEWEYACRAGTETPWSFGDYNDFEKVAHEYAWWSDGNQAKHEIPRTVAQGKPNAFGLHDMHGNVWEYVADYWHRLYYKESPLNDPTGPEVQSEKGDQRRIIRGSSFDWGRWGGDSAYRMRITQRSGQHPHMGFRVALRIKNVQGVPPAVDPDAPRRQQKRDPGANSKAVVNARRDASKRDVQPRELSIDLDGNVKMEFVLIPAGSFLMGSDQGPKDERPIHRVVISKPFYMAKLELTQSQWEAIMGPDRRLSELRKGDNDMAGPTKAMNSLSWNDCQKLIQRLRSKVPGHSFTLPTEAQWEYACRAGSTTEYSFGNDASQLGKYAWHEGNMVWPGKPGFKGRTLYHDTGVKLPNPWGLHDLHGGVWEWCSDRYDPDYYFDAALLDPQGPDTGRFRVLRGGSWFRYAKYARSAYRRFFHPQGDSDGVTAWILDFGCRLVINLENQDRSEPR